jgi:hypothetical protein
VAELRQRLLKLGGFTGGRHSAVIKGIKCSLDGHLRRLHGRTRRFRPSERDRVRSILIRWNGSLRLQLQKSTQNETTMKRKSTISNLSV